LNSLYSTKGDTGIKVYLDVCCLCRPFDESQDNRITLKADAVLAILDKCKERWVLVTIEVISHELNAITSFDKREKAFSFLSIPHEHVTLTQDIIRTAELFWQNVIDTYDALHYACALSAGAPFITVDDLLIKKLSLSLAIKYI
jgi:predicted nucleic acid-binding protein